MYQRLLTTREARRNEDGFTLIELLIVIVILGVLAAIVVFSAPTASPTSAKAADCKTRPVAAEAYNAKTGSATRPTVDRAGHRQRTSGGARRASDVGHRDRRRRRHSRRRAPALTR